MSSKSSKYRILFTCLHLIAVTVACAQNLDTKITIQAHNQSLEEVIRQISEKGNILFSYNPQSIPVAKKISVDAYNSPLSDVFKKVFTANGIDYTITEKQVILKLHNPGAPADPVAQQVSVKKYTLSGYIKDKATGEAIIGANVYDMASMQGTTTNSYGFYSLSLPQGTYNITNSFIGYSQVTQQIELNKNLDLTVELDLSPVVMKAVEITADNKSDEVRLSQSGDMRLSPAVLKQIPGFAGNIDVLKSLQNVPGILTFGDGSSFYFVRGGNSDQNLLLIDEAPIYNPSHLFGFFSALAPSAIKDVKVYKGDAPANYGGSLSSVVDVRAREGNLKLIGFAGNIGPYTCDFTLEGPIIREKSSFLVSGRKSILNWLPFSYDDHRTYFINFYDINAKFNIQINKNNRLYLTAFTGKDVFDRYNTLNNNTFGISWTNVVGTLRWNHIFNNRLFSNTTAYISRYNYYLDIAEERRNYWTSSISNATIKSDFSWYLNPKNTIKTGMEIGGHQSNPGNVQLSDQETRTELPYVSEYRSVEYAFYLSNEQQISRKFFARYGIRLTRWNDLGPTSVYYFDANYNSIDTIAVAKNTVYQSFFNVEPRLTFKYAISDYASLQISYNHTSQHLQVLSNSTSPFTSLVAWAPSGPNIKPEQADQFSLGFFTKVFRRQFDFSVETYYKQLHNQIDYTDHANLLFNPLLEGQLRFGKGWSYGIETLLRKSSGKFTGWVSYAYSRSLRQIADVNAGETFPASWDRPHNICITFSYGTGNRWNYSAHWIYLTGAPFTSPTGFYYVNGYTVPVYGSKNNDRYPAYNRLDVSVSYTISKPERKYQQSLMLTIYNAYGRHNPFSVNFNKILDNNEIVVPSDLEGNLKLITTDIYAAGIIPSLNYSFRF